MAERSDGFEKKINNDLEFDVAADLADLMKPKDEPAEDLDTQTEESTSEELDLSEEHDVPDFFSKDGEKDESGDTGEQTKDDESIGESTEDPNSFKFRSGGKDYDLNPSVPEDMELIRKYLPFGPVGEKLHTELGRARQDNKRLVAEVKVSSEDKEDAAFARRVREAATDGDPALAYEIATGGDKFYDVVKAEAKRMIEYAEASTEERAILDSNRNKDELQKRVDRLEKAAQARESKAADDNMTALQREKYAEALPYHRAIVKGLGIEDPATRTRTATTIWRDAWAEIEDQTDADLSKVTPEMIKRELISAGKLFGFSAANKSNKQIAEAVTKRKKEAKAKAGASATQRYTTPKVKDKTKGLGPLAAFDALRKAGSFGRGR